MVEVTKLELAKRDAIGSNAVRAMRRAGKIPIVLYGHGRDTVPLEADGRELREMLGRNIQFLELTIEGQTETALVRDIQYDTYGLDVLHVDLVRADIDEAINVSVQIEYRGLPKGLSDGGLLEKLLTEVEMKVSPRLMPEKIVVTVTDLGVDDSILLKDLPIPESAELLDDPEKIVCLVAAQRVAEEEEAAGEGEGEEGAAEPEVVGQKKEDAGDSE